MKLQHFKTLSSYWTVDEDTMTFVRSPRVEDAEHPRVPYGTEAISFERAYFTDDRRVSFYRRGEAVPFIVSGTLLAGQVFEDLPR